MLTGHGAQCDQIWQIFATVAQFKSLGQIIEGLFSIWRNFILLWQECFTIGHVFIVVDAQMR